MGGKTRVNYYVREEDLDEEFLEGLRVRKIDEKFLYIGKQHCNAWFNLCNSPEYDYYRNSKELLKNTSKKFVSHCNDNVNVIALGPGNGLKEKLVVEALQQSHQVDLFLVDISREVIDVAIENMEDNDTPREAFVADLMHSKDIAKLSRYARRQYNATSFFTLLGNTLGNYLQPVILKSIREAMAPGDKILIGVLCESPDNAEEKVLQIAKTIEAYNNPANRELLHMLLSEAGITAADGIIEVEFGKDEYFPKMDVVKKYFRFTRSKNITYRGEAMYFAKDERIQMGYANKYTFEFLENLLNSHGLHIIESAQDDTRKYRQLLCELA